MIRTSIQFYFKCLDLQAFTREIVLQFAQPLDQHDVEVSVVASPSSCSCLHADWCYVRPGLTLSWQREIRKIQHTLSLLMANAHQGSIFFLGLLKDSLKTPKRERQQITNNSKSPPFSKQPNLY